MKTERIHFMDPLRGILMALGVLLHSAQVFNPEFAWLISSPQTTTAAPLLVSIIHFFRMPAFYIVSGFFALITFKKYGGEKFLKLRFEKILIPFIVTALTLNSLQAWLLHSNLNPMAVPFNLNRYFLNGEWVSHLWFLGYLFAYVLILFIFGRFFSAQSAASHPDTALNMNGGKSEVPRSIEASKSVPARRWRLPLPVLILFLPLYYLGLVIFGKLVPQIYEFRFGFSIYDLLFYLQFFLFGLALAAWPQLFQQFTRLRLVPSILLIAAGAAVSHFAVIPNELLTKIVDAYIRLLITWASCQLVFSIFKALADKPARWATFASSASYTVYLFHHILVILFGLLLIQFQIGGLVGFLLLTVIASVLGSMIHVGIISNSRVLKYLFNGTRSGGLLGAPRGVAQTTP